MTISEAGATRAEGRHRLAEHMELGRRRLNLTWREVAARGGPSVPTLRQLRRADPIDWPPSTLRKLDDGLDWEPGSSSGVLYEIIDEPRLRTRKPWWDEDQSSSHVFSEDVRRGLERLVGAVSLDEDWKHHRAAS